MCYRFDLLCLVEIVQGSSQKGFFLYQNNVWTSEFELSQLLKLGGVFSTPTSLNSYCLLAINEKYLYFHKLILSLLKRKRHLNIISLLSFDVRSDFSSLLIFRLKYKPAGRKTCSGICCRLSGSLQALPWISDLAFALRYHTNRSSRDHGYLEKRLQLFSCSMFYGATFLVNGLTGQLRTLIHANLHKLFCVHTTKILLFTNKISP